MNAPQLGSGESKLETVISWLLIIGVIISLLLEIGGIAMYYHAYGQLGISTDQSMFIQGKNFFTFLYDQFRTGQTGSGAARLMIGGIVILMLTPYLRVVVSALYFAREKNMKYVVITMFVLIILTLSLLKH
jgi:uncharacterized membrane protein